MTGGAVHLACQEVVARLIERAVDAQGLRPGTPVSAAFHDGVVEIGGEAMTVESLLEEPVSMAATYHHRPTTGFDERGQGDVHVMFAFAAERAVVEVDPDLGLLRVVQVACVQDVGRALNPQMVQGQIEGGTAQGLGLGIMEELIVRDGVIRNASFTDYLIPTVLDMPPVVSEIVEDPEPGSPFGIKGVGETSTIVATAAVVAAIRNATGLDLNRCPVKPDDLVGLRGPATTSGPAPIPDVPGNRPIPEYVGVAAGQQELMKDDG
jgi:CO/xanthine dehydrogenase Mo-binding subunit